MSTSKPSKKRGLQRPPQAREPVDGTNLQHPVADQPARDQNALIVPLSRIRVQPGQPRQTFTEESLNELAQDIQANGLVNPITVTQDGQNFNLVAGERRYRALQILKATDAPVRIIPQEQARAVQLAENIQREDLPILEEAQALAALRDERGLTVRELAGLVNKSRGYVQRRLEITTWPADVQLFLQENPGMLTQAAEIAKVSDDGRRQKRIANASHASASGGEEPAVPRQPGRPPEPFRFSPRRGGGFDIQIKYRPGQADRAELLQKLKELIRELEGADE